MKLDFAKNTRRNIVSNAIGSGIKLLFPFLNRTMFLWLLGPEYLGLNGLFVSLLGMLMLAELGFGSAVGARMYKLVADDDRDGLCAYLAFYRNVYRCVGATIFAVGLALMPFLRRLVHGDLPPDVDLHILYLIHLVNTSVSYFMFAYRGAVLAAHNRNDVVVNIRTGVSVAQYVAVFLVLALTRNYYYYVVAMVVFTVLQNVLLVKAAHRLFPDITPRGEIPEAARKVVVSDVKSIFLHKVGGVITSSTDNVVVSAFLGLVAVASYGNYYYVVTSVAGLTGVLYTSLLGGFGNKIHTETKAQNFALFIRMNRITLTLVACCAAMMLALYQPFMKIWTKGDPALVRHGLTVALMVFYFYINQARQTLLTFKAAAALWREDRLKPIVAGAVNLGSNILFVLFLPEEYKLDGVIFSTILGFVLIQIPWETHVVFSRFFSSRELSAYCRMHAVFAMGTLALCAAAWFSVRLVPLEGMLGLIAKGAAAAAVTVVLVAIFARRHVLAALDDLRTKRN